MWEDWLNDNIDQMNPKIEELKTNNTVIITTLGDKSKLVGRQILCKVVIQGYVHEGVFLVVPKSVHNCILVINAS